MKNNENPILCAECGGKCCKKYPGTLLPLDVPGGPTEESILALVRTGKYCLDANCVYTEEDIEHAILNVRPRVKGFLDSEVHIIFDHLYRNRNLECCFLEENGCSLSFDERPGVCKNLIPVKGEECEMGRINILSSWREHQEMMHRVMRRLKDQERKFDAHNTAIKRNKPSSVARLLFSSGIIEENRVKSIFDFGCGHGDDVRFYREQGLRSEGYDPHPDFGWFPPEQVEQFDMVTLTFVLNVISDAEERLHVIDTAQSILKDGGIILISTRTSREIEGEARKKSWEPFGDGYISSPTRGTFQTGIDGPDILEMMKVTKIRDGRIVLEDASKSVVMGTRRYDGFMPNVILRKR